MSFNAFDKDNLLKEIQEIRQTLDDKNRCSSDSDDSISSNYCETESDSEPNDISESERWLANTHGYAIRHDERAKNLECVDTQDESNNDPSRKRVEDVIAEASRILSNESFKSKGRPESINVPSSYNQSPLSISGLVSPIDKNSPAPSLLQLKHRRSVMKNALIKQVKNEDVDSTVIVSVPPSLQSKTKQQKEQINMTNLYVERIFRSFRDKGKNFQSIGIEDVQMNRDEFVSTSDLATLEHLLQVNKKYQEVLSDQLKKVRLARSQNKRMLDELEKDKTDVDKSATYSALSKCHLGKFENSYFKDADGFAPPENEDTRRRTFHLKTMGPTKVAKPWRETENNALREGVYNNNLELRIAPLLAKAKVLEKDYACRQKNGEAYIDKSRRRDIMKKIQEIKKLPQEEILKDTNEIDFFKLTRKYLPYRDEFECRIHWLNVLHPLVNQKLFSAEEDAMLLKLAEKYKNRNWPLIAEELGTNRTPIQCLQRFQRSLNKDMLKTSWDKEADERLIEAVKLFGHDWVSVSSYVGDRSKNQCLFRWDKTLNPAIKRGKWSKEEDQALLAAVKKFGKGNWKKIKYDIPGRTDAQCRERYVNCLDPNINFSPFTPEEDQIIKDYVAEHGLGKWSAIAQKLVNRRDSHVWRRYKQIESEKYIKYQRNTLWKKKSVMNHFQSRGSEKPHYELKELNVKGTPEISYRESLKMEKMRRKLKRKGIDDDKILKHIARLHYEGKFSTHGMWIAKDNIKHKQTFKLVADVPPQQKYKGKIKDKLFVEISSLSEESDEETNSEVSENILKERDNNKKSYTRPSESFITAVTNAIYEANDPEKDLPLVACKEIMIQKIKKRIFFPPRPVEKHDGEKLHHYCKYILRKNDLRFEDAKSRLEKMMINTDIDRATNNKRKKIIQPYLDKLIGKHETFLNVSEMMVKQNNLTIILKKSVLKRRLIEIEDEENTSDVPFQKISNIRIKKEPIDSDLPSKRKKFKLKVSHRSQRSKQRNKKRTHTSRLLSKIQQGSFESDKEDDICESNSDDNNIGTESPIDHSIVENEVVISNTVQEPVNDNHQNEDSQLRTFTLLLQALHVDTRKIMQTLPQAEQNTNLPDNNVDQNEDDIFPECFPLSPNVTTLGGFRTLLLHRRHLFNIVNKQYPPIFQTLPAVRDLRYRETRAYEALTKRFKSTFFWPSFLATFSPKYIQDTSSTSKEK